MKQQFAALPLSPATIQPGKRAIVTARCRTLFRPQRLTISPHSFAVPWLRRFWTWPLIHTGFALRRVHRGLVQLLKVNLYASHERHERVADDYGGEDVFEDEDDGLRYRKIEIPLNRRERFVSVIGRAASHLSAFRTRWQQSHLAHLVICDVTVAKRSQLAGEVPGDLFAAPAIDSFVTFDACQAEHDITVEIENGSSRECQLKMALIGTSIQ